MNIFDRLWQDIRIALRMLWKSRGASSLAVLSIALGIGLTTSLFSVANTFIFRPFSFTHPDEVFSVFSRGDDQRTIGYGWRDCEDITRASEGLGEVIAYQRLGLLLAGESGSEIAMTYVCTHNYFSMLGANTAIGDPSITIRSDGRPQVVIGHRLWMRRFGGDTTIVGKTIQLNSTAFVVAGVMPPAFNGLVRGVPCDIWIGTDSWFELMGHKKERESRRDQFELLVRLRPDISPDSVAGRFDAAIRSPEGHKPAPAGTVGTRLQALSLTWKEKLVKGGFLLPVFGLLLLVACANAAQLRLAQAEARRKEMGVRLALGSSPWGLARLLLIETLLVSGTGAAAGLLIANKVIVLMSSTISTAVGLHLDLEIDWRVGVFTLATTVFASVLAGIAPIRHALRLNVLDILKSEEGTVRMKNRLQRWLVAGQTAASVVFFGLALLFTMSLHNAAAVRPGFDQGKSMVVMPVIQGLPISRNEWCRQASERLQSVPGVRAVTFARRLPLSSSGGGMRLRVESPGTSPIAVSANMVGPNYFTVMGTHVLTGRSIGSEDRNNTAPVVVVSQILARQIFGEHNPIGESITIEGKLWQIVGIAEDAPSRDLHQEPQPMVYLALAQMPRGDITLLVETTVEAEALIRTLQQELKHFDPGVATYDVKTLRQHIDQALFADRMTSQGAMGLGALGFLLTAAGLFGLVQHSVNRRTREIGIRMALGAGLTLIRRSVLIESLRIVFPGIVLGLILLVGGGWCVRSSLLGVTPLNPLAYVGCAIAAIAVCLLATWIPAQRATHIDPVEALRAE